ncbi:hypothetical protein EG328_002811 [Venturia inaequalis]|uniref:TPR-like protein n=1 Tax=Venturia inaequalis TaxID=5025 RepID=A0A8H3YLE0_VENIN|nr:hypothetical protein EG327_000765 [Venturia inaequalis]KAE9987454.1 hypothetical protein EG328_002811 [Venturia inaequalis]RDI86991.1 hypothetical protein Vi05172_g3191 [Venturia inaequalis]
MAPSTPLVASQLHQLIFYHLDNDFLQNALFFAGRLHGLEPRSPDTAHLLALCHLKLGHFKAAYDYSRDSRLRGNHLGCAFVFAQSCLALERYQDGAVALEKCRGLWAVRNHWNQHSEVSRRHQPDAAAVLCLLGKLCKANGETKRAADYYAESLKLNPFMWDAFQDLCDSGVPLRPSNVFKTTDEMRVRLSTSMNTATPAEGPLQTNPNGLNVPNTPGIYDPFNNSRSALDPGLNHGGPNFMSRLNGNIPSFPAQGQSLTTDWDTPVTNGTLYEEDVMMSDGQTPHDGGAPAAPLRAKGPIKTFISDITDAPRMKTITSRYRKTATESSNEAEPTRGSSIPVNHKRTVSGHAPPGTSSSSIDSQSTGVRRSARIKDNPVKASSSSRVPAMFNRNTESREKKELPKARAPGIKGRSTAGRAVSGNSRPPPPGEREPKDSRPASSTSSIREVAASRKQIAPLVDVQEPSNQEQEALQWLLSLCARLGEGYYELSRYRCLQALQILESITISQKETPWVLAQIGKAHYERSCYAKAAEVFARMRKTAPSRTENMEVYSTVLWHLKQDLDLAYLSHELMEIDRLSPEAWCAIGNSFSLQREHDQAIKCFKRATQLDPKFAYAFTLQGHEHIANEEYDKAVHAYRCAISADNRHYNGWYGLGQVYEKLGQWDIAEKHYRSASQINQTNPVLCVCIGLILEKLKKSREALAQYSKAVDLDNKSAKARFMKARVLMKLRRPREAYTELEILKNIAPDESMVHFMLGRLSKMLKDKTGAIKHLTIAMNLDPKAAPHIKDALESLDASDDDFDEEDME